MRPVLSVFIVAFIIVITCCNLAIARPFFNIFNVAIQTDFTEDGNIVSFVYPKNKYQLDLKFNSEKVTDHSFNFGGLFQSIARNFKKRLGSFNPFKFLTTTTTTEVPLDFSDEDNSDSSVSVSSDGYSSFSSSNNTNDAIENDSESSSDSEAESPSPNISEISNDSNEKSNSQISDSETPSNGYTYPDSAISVKIEQASISYLPPSTLKSTYLPPN